MQPDGVTPARIGRPMDCLAYSGRSSSGTTTR